MRKQRGFTAIELCMALFMAVWLGVVGMGLYAAGHFIAKFW